MKIVIEQSKLKDLVTYQAPSPLAIKCRKCKEWARIIMLVHDDEGDIASQRPDDEVGFTIKVWPHDKLVVYVYLCTNCGAMRATWNQG